MRRVHASSNGHLLQLRERRLLSLLSSVSMLGHLRNNNFLILSIFDFTGSQARGATTETLKGNETEISERDQGVHA